MLEDRLKEETTEEDVRQGKISAINTIVGEELASKFDLESLDDDALDALLAKLNEPKQESITKTIEFCDHYNENVALYMLQKMFKFKLNEAKIVLEEN